MNALSLTAKVSTALLIAATVCIVNLPEAFADSVGASSIASGRVSADDAAELIELEAMDTANAAIDDGSQWPVVEALADADNSRADLSIVTPASVSLKKGDKAASLK